METQIPRIQSDFFLPRKNSIKERNMVKVLQSNIRSHPNFESTRRMIIEELKFTLSRSEIQAGRRSAHSIHLSERPSSHSPPLKALFPRSAER